MLKELKEYLIMDGAVIAIISAFVVAICSLIALIVNGINLRQETKSRRFQIFQNVFVNLMNLQEKLYTEYATKKQEWFSIFFNSLEFFAYSVNKNYISYKEFKEFFGNAVIRWYEKIFLEYCPDDEKNPKKYKELKSLYNKLKNP